MVRSRIIRLIERTLGVHHPADSKQGSYLGIKTFEHHSVIYSELL